MDESSYLRGVLRKEWLGLGDLDDRVRFDRDDLFDYEHNYTDGRLITHFSGREVRCQNWAGFNTVNHAYFRGDRERDLDLDIERRLSFSL